MKRIAAFLTLLMLLVSSMAFAEGVVVIGEKNEAQDNHNRAERVSGPHNSGYWTYYLLDDGTAEISAYNRYPSGTLHIPTTLDRLQVSSIALAAEVDPFGTLVIPDSVTNVLNNPCAATCKKIDISLEHPTLATIDGVLFNKKYKRLLHYPNSKKDTTYTIPKGIREIADNAFCYDDDLRTITIPDTVTRIDGNPFYDCENLTKLNISATHPNLVMNGSALIDQDTGTLHTYLLGSKATEFAVPSGVTRIGSSAFSRCSSLSYISLPEGLTEIGASAFFKVPLDAIILPDGLTSIGSYAFLGGAKNVTIPASVEFIGKNAFREDVILTVDHDSYALEYARANNLEYTYTDSLDWLLD